MTTKPNRRVCDQSCEYMLPAAEWCLPRRCVLRPGAIDHSYVYPCDKCRADAGALRRRASNPAGWEADELRARGLRV